MRGGTIERKGRWGEVRGGLRRLLTEMCCELFLKGETKAVMKRGQIQRGGQPSVGQTMCSFQLFTIFEWTKFDRHLRERADRIGNDFIFVSDSLWKGNNA